MFQLSAEARLDVWERPKLSQLHPSEGWRFHLVCFMLSDRCERRCDKFCVWPYRVSALPSSLPSIVIIWLLTQYDSSLLSQPSASEAAWVNPALPFGLTVCPQCPSSTMEQRLILLFRGLTPPYATEHLDWAADRSVLTRWEKLRLATIGSPTTLRDITTR